MHGRNRVQWVIVNSAVLVGITMGCATPQEGRITSNPPGAVVHLQSMEGKRIPLGKTPVQATARQGIWQTYLVAELDGYDTARWLLPRTGAIAHHFTLERDLANRIREEATAYTVPYKKAILEVVGRGDKVLNSPRMLAGSAASDARTELQKLRLEFPAYRNNAADLGMERMVSTAELVAGLPRSSYNTATEVILAAQLSDVVKKIRSGLGV